MDTMIRKIKILCIILFSVILINAIVGEINESIYRSGYSECDIAKFVNLDCNEEDNVNNSVKKILDLIEVYKCSVIWRKVFLISVCITVLYFCISKDEIGFKNFSILLILTFLFNYQLMSYMLFHSYLPVCNLMKKNLDHIKKMD